MSLGILNICTKSLFGALMMVSALCISQPAHAQVVSKSADRSTQKLGFKLVTKFWQAVEHQNVKKYSFLLAPHFQGINISGVYTRKDQILGLKSLTVTQFTITKLIAARFHDTMTVSYDFTAEGTGIVSGPSMDIWHKKDGVWKLISHTYVPYLT